LNNTEGAIFQNQSLFLPNKKETLIIQPNPKNPNSKKYQTPFISSKKKKYNARAHSI
jgi:hypothetical protein